jgi:hypothetical protein
MSEQLRLRRAGLEWRAVEGEIVALDLPRSTYLAANRTGSLLWEALARGTTREELVEALSREYSLEREAAERDVDAFVADLRDRGLVELA